MHLKSIIVKGFKSFPDRTRLDFGPGVSVVVGPNGSGKSNITDAVLWAMGEQSPLAVRGQSMQDVIFGGGRGVQARSEAEVEIVLDNCDGALELPLSEISIVRRLDRTGEGGYRLNGARCRLTDVIELLSDTGLGKETHSIISQGRVDAIVTSRPRERRMLIEEAAGLGKHRKRRRRAQLKLERTQENLDRALDVEREARTRLRPLKRQAEAAELHERLERQTLEARLELARDAARSRSANLQQAERGVGEARASRATLEQQLQQTVDRRALAERALAERAERRDALARRAYAARSSRERIALRGEQVAGSTLALQARIERARPELEALDGEEPQHGAEPTAGGELVALLQEQLAQIEAAREVEIDAEIADLRSARDRQHEQHGEVEAQVLAARTARAQADERAGEQRARLAAEERRAQEARRESERVGGELAAANQFLRSHVRVGGEGAAAPRALSEELSVREGYELALAAALGGRLDAALAADVAGAQSLLDGSGADGATVLLAESEPRERPPGDVQSRAQPAPGAVRLLELLSGPPGVMALAERLLADAWVVERIEELSGDFGGIAATRSGRVWFASWGELRQLTEGGSERVLARRNERDRLIAAAERTAQAEQAARAACEQALVDLRAAEEACAAADSDLREAERRLTEIAEARHRSEWLIEQRRAAPAQGPLAVRRAELEGELAAERRAAERVQEERTRRVARLARLRAQHDADTATLPGAERLATALAALVDALEQRVSALEASLAGDRVAGEEMAAELRACAAREAEIQAGLREAGERVTEAEVAAQRLRDAAAEAQLELSEIVRRLGLELAGSEDGEVAAELAPEEREGLEARVQRLQRRREQLGPVNPLAQTEYTEAVAHVEELERQRTDLETALRELRAVIRETDRQIHESFTETFEAASRNFEELVGDVFPGGAGKLTLITEERAPRPVLGGQELPAEEHEAASEAAADAEAEAQELEREGEQEDLPGVEIEITPAGKSTKRLSLLSGGEKSMTALAFVFAVFLARPCPFYILDEVEAALDDANLDRFLALLRRYSERAQFIVITHQKRTMEAADWLYGVSMGGDGVSKVLSRRLPSEAEEQRHAEVAEVA